MADDDYISGEEYQAMSRKQPPKRGHEIALSTKMIGTIVMVIILCIISFFIGDSYGKSHAKTTASVATTNRYGGGYGGSFSGGFRSGNGSFGQVTAISSSSITIQNPRSGTSTTYSITGSTTITDNGQTIAASAIQTGNTVLVRVASSGSTTATSIMVVSPPTTSSSGGSNGTSSGSSTIIQ